MFDVVVVGAGIGGLATARRLVGAGRSVKVVEARNRVGGRLRSQGSLDLGATWFWPNEPRIQALIEDLGVAIHPQYLQGDAVYQTPGGSVRIKGNPLDAECGRFSLGAEELARSMAERLPRDSIRLDCPIVEIRGDAVHIEAQGDVECFVARHLVLAIPPALAMASISFSPRLPESLAELAAMTPVWMGATTKVVAHYSEPFWRKEALAGAAISHLGPMREVHDMSGPDGESAALFGFLPSVPGRAAPSEAVLRQQFVSLFGPRGGEAQAVIVQDWLAEKFTSPAGTEGLSAYQLFGHELYAKPALNGRLHWATTETSRDFPGHIEGALAAAERAAGAVLGALE